MSQDALIIKVVVGKFARVGQELMPDGYIFSVKEKPPTPYRDSSVTIYVHRRTGRDVKISETMTILDVISSEESAEDRVLDLLSVLQNM